MKDGWKADARKRWAVAIVVAFVLVAGIANVMEYVMENWFGISYVIHWLETVPIITLVFAFVLQKGWAPKPHAHDGAATAPSADSEE